MSQDCRGPSDTVITVRPNAREVLQRRIKRSSNRRAALCLPLPLPGASRLLKTDPARCRQERTCTAVLGAAGRRAGARVRRAAGPGLRARIVVTRRNPHPAFAMNTDFARIAPEAHERRFRLYSRDRVPRGPAFRGVHAQPPDYPYAVSAWRATLPIGRGLWGFTRFCCN
jgi:hypothetical protein